MSRLDLDLRSFVMHRMDALDEATLPPGAGLHPLYRPWGFTIYRTVFSDSEHTSRGLERDWQALVETIRTHVRVDFESRARPNASDDDDAGRAVEARLALSLFRLETRSEPAALLKDKTRAELRDIHRNWAPGVFDGDGPPHPQVFLVADQDVFDAMKQGIFIIKCVEIDHIENLPTPTGRPPRMPPSYFGWMQLTTRHVVELWYWLLDVFTLEEMAPPIPASQTVTTWTGS